MKDVAPVSASDLLETSDEKKPAEKKSRPMLPPGYKVQPIYPGATYGLHPVDRLMIKLVDSKSLETPGDESTPAPTDAPPITRKKARGVFK